MDGSGERHQLHTEEVLGSPEVEPRFDSVLSRLVQRNLPEHSADTFRHLQILDRTSALLAEVGPDLPAILQVITRQVSGLGVDLCVIRLLSQDGNWLVPVAYYHPNSEAEQLLKEILSVPQPADEGLLGHVVQRGEPLLIPALGASEIQAIVKPHWRAYLEEYGIHSVLVVPLRARGQIRGALGVFRSGIGFPYTYDDQILAKELADHAALAIDNTRLFEQLSDREQQLQHFVGQLLLAQERERRTVAYDVHDGLAQVAASAHQHLQAFAYEHPPSSAEAAEQLDRCLELARRTIREARRVISNLRPTALDDFGVVGAIRMLVSDFREDGLHVELNEVLGDARFSSDIETTVFRVAQEALNNAWKHAGHSPIRVSLSMESNQLILIVQDWGEGFDLNSNSSGPTVDERVGLRGMQERIAMVGGSFRIHSEPGAGCHIEVRVPATAREEEGQS